jgi:hypothetical protein
MKPLVHTRRKTISPLLSALTGKVPLQPAKAVNLALKPYLALDCFARTQGNNYLYGTLVQYALISQYLCNKGYLRENLDSPLSTSPCATSWQPSMPSSQ